MLTFAIARSPEKNMLDAKSLDAIFREARTHNAVSGPVTDAQLREIYELMKWGPTTMNTQPGRFVFVRSKEGKEKLKPALSPGNLDKTMAAPVTVILGYDLQFYENLPKTFPHRPDAKNGFMGEEKKAGNQLAAGRVLHHRRARAGLGLRPDVRLRQRQGGCGVLPGRPREVELPH
jgi:nitroreductase